MRLFSLPRGNVRCVYLLATLSGLATGHAVFLTQHQQVLLGSSTQAIGALVTIAALTQVAAELPSGLLADTLGRKPTLAAATICRLASVSVLTVASGWGHFAASTALDAVAGALVSGTDSALLWDSLEDGRGFQQAMATAQTLWACAAAVAAMVGGLVAMPTALVMSHVYLVLALVVCAAIRDPPRSPPHVAAARTWTAVSTTAFRALRQPHLAALVAIGIATHAFGEAPHRFRAVYYTARGVSRAHVGVLAALGLACGSAGALCAPRLVAGRDARPVLALAVLALALCGAGAAMSAGSSGALWLLGSSLAWGIQGPILAGLVHAHAPSTARVTVISVLALTRKLGLALWAPVMGAVADRASISHAYGACAAGLLATAAGVSVTRLKGNDQKSQ